ncbi:PspC domain-containing protein [Candidatus Micrarchaeota archaeon]|nr:PspC domain-containing protein [Candidatus Micrarchaeota archaeon]
MPKKRLHLSSTDKTFLGVCGGLAEYLNADPTVVRLVWVIVTLFTGIVPGILAYFLAWAVMPKKG